jgi:hypothetical protein
MENEDDQVINRLCHEMLIRLTYREKREYGLNGARISGT